MEIQKYLLEKKNLQELILKYFDEDNDDYNFQQLDNLFSAQKIHKNKSDLTELLHLLLKIANDHHRLKDFFIKIEKVFLCFTNEIKQTYSNFEIINIFKNNNRILLFLYKENIISLDEFRCQFHENQKTKKTSKIKEGEFIVINDQNGFEEKLKKGENDNYICYLIQNDLIDDFIIYVNQKNISLSSSIQKSIFETNSYLIENDPTLIEYSAFFGSIQIFKYLYLNNVNVTSDLWIYSIHGRNPEIIHFLEENKIQPKDKSFNECLFESIKCHHNEIANYFQNNFISYDQNQNDLNLVLTKSFESFNYFFFPNEINNESEFFDLCKFGYDSLVKILLKSIKLNVNEKVIFIQIFIPHIISNY